jgi:hypothetical protein
MEMIVRGGLGKAIGHRSEEKDYTPEEIFSSATEVAEIYNDFVEYLKSVHIIPDIYHAAAPPEPPVTP